MGNSSSIKVCILLSILNQSCSSKKDIGNLEEVVKQYEESSVSNRFYKFTSYVFQKGDVRVVKDTNGTCTLTFERIAGIVCFANEHNCTNSGIWSFVKEMNRIHLLGISRGEGFSIYYSSISHDKVHKFVFVHTKKNSDLPRNMFREHNIIKINKNWYYYTSNLYGSYNEF